MPTEVAAEQLKSVPEQDLTAETLAKQIRDRRIGRMGFGITLTFLIAMAFDWTLAYLAPCFVTPLLQARAAPSFSTAVRVLLAAFMLMLVCYLGAGFAGQFPVVFLLALIPGLFWTFRFSLRGGSLLIVLLLLIGFMLLPMVAKYSTQLAWDMAASFVGNIALSLVVTYLMFMFFPALPSEPEPAPKPRLAASEIDRQAWIMTAVTGSFTWAYFSFDWTNVHTPIYIAIYIHQLSLASSLKVTKGILGANIIAGFVAMVLYTLLVMAPSFAFLAALSLTVILVFARLITSGAAWAPLAGFALSSTLILLGSAMSSLGDNGGDKFTDRLGELGAAALYAVAAMYVLQTYFPGKLGVSEN
ncbi:MAG: DUF2955 domain-containing protein [Lysobacterales bacterium]